MQRAAHKVCLVSLGRPNEGEARRRQSWRRLLDATGVDVVDISLLEQSTALRTRITGRPFVPESVLWDEHALMTELAVHEPDAVVLVTARCWTPRLLELKTKLVVDLVDRLSVNYQIREQYSSGPEAVMFRMLAKRHAAAERELEALRPLVQLTYAGRNEAKTYGGTWLPNVVAARDMAASIPGEAASDLVFFGTLYNPLNVHAVEALARHASGALRNRSVVLAGRAPNKRVASIAEANGWTLVRDFPSVPWLAQLAKVAVAPMGPVTGIQNKVIEACSAAMPVVASAAALHGIADDVPLLSGLDQDAAIVAAAELATKPAAVRRTAGIEAAKHASAKYTADAWRHEVNDLLFDNVRPFAPRVGTIEPCHATRVAS